MVLLLLFETQHSFCKDRNSNASKNLYITSTHTSYKLLYNIYLPKSDSLKLLALCKAGSL